jgi:hypothetical protein
MLGDMPKSFFFNYVDDKKETREGQQLFYFSPRYLMHKYLKNKHFKISNVCPACLLWHSLTSKVEQESVNSELKSVSACN